MRTCVRVFVRFSLNSQFFWGKRINDKRSPLNFTTNDIIIMRKSQSLSLPPSRSTRPVISNCIRHGVALAGQKCFECANVPYKIFLLSIFINICALEWFIMMTNDFLNANIDSNLIFLISNNQFDTFR